MIGLLTLFGTALVATMALLTAFLAREMRRPPRHTTAYALAKGLPCDPGDLNPPLTFEEWWLDRPNGAQLPVWDIAISNADLQGPQLTAVFVHGWGHSRVDVLPRINVFVPVCSRIILFDLRGHGEARNCLSNLGQHEEDDVLALLERLGDLRILLVGLSMGAVIAIKMAAKAQRSSHSIADRLAGIIAYGPYCQFSRSLQGRLKVAGYPARPISDLALLTHRLHGLVPLSLRDQDVGAIDCPLLIIHGCDDQVAPLEHSQRLARSAKNATLVSIEGAAHVDAHTVDAKRHDDAVGEFLRSILHQTQRHPALSEMR